MPTWHAAPVHSSRGRHPVRVLLLAVAATVVAACGVAWDAPNVSLTMQSNGIVYTRVDGPSSLVGGETVLRIDNGSAQPRRIVLAHVPEGDEIPAEILEAEAARDDPRILGYSSELDPQELASDLGGMVTHSASFHVHLRPGERHVVFDAYTGADGPVRWLVPGPDGDQMVQP